MYAVKLSARQDPDFPRRDDLPAAQVVPVATFREASEVCRRFIDEHGLGSGSWNGGEVRDVTTGKVVAIVSYNGRVWTPQRRWQDRKEIAM